MRTVHWRGRVDGDPQRRVQGRFDMTSASEDTVVSGNCRRGRPARARSCTPAGKMPASCPDRLHARRDGRGRETPPRRPVMAPSG